MRKELSVSAFHSATMARHIAFALLLSLFVCGQNIASADFGFYYFVLQWPGSYCNSVGGCCKPTTFDPYPLDADFLVKGLYTSSSSGQPVTKCNTTKFYVNALRNLITELYVHWPSIECPSNNGVSQWRDAWTNYGVCTGLSQNDYFNNTLLLRKKTNLLSVLKGKGIVPSDTRTYNPTNVNTAIRSALGANVGIKCSANKSGAFQIDEIYVCVDKTASKVIECPVFPKFSCGTAAYFPYYSNSMLKSTSSSFDPLQMVTSQ